MYALFLFLASLSNPIHSHSHIYGIKPNSCFLHATILKYEYHDYPVHHCWAGVLLQKRPQEFIRVRLESNTGHFCIGDTISIQIQPRYHKPEIGKQYIIHVYSNPNHSNQTTPHADFTVHQFLNTVPLEFGTSTFKKLHERL